MTSSSKSSSSASSSTMTTNPGEKWFIGQRVVDEEGHRATVRYVGPVATSKDPEAIWIGKQLHSLVMEGFFASLTKRLDLISV